MFDMTAAVFYILTMLNISMHVPLQAYHHSYYPGFINAAQFNQTTIWKLTALSAVVHQAMVLGFGSFC